MAESMIKLIRNMFDKNKELTLKQIYDSLEENSKIEITGNTLKHRIRSSIYSLKKGNFVKRITVSTYQKLSC